MVSIADLIDTGQSGIVGLERLAQHIRLIVQHTIESTRTTSAALNHGERNTWKTPRRSRAPTPAVPNSGSYSAWITSIWSA